MPRQRESSHCCEWAFLIRDGSNHKNQFQISHKTQASSGILKDQAHFWLQYHPLLHPKAEPRSRIAPRFHSTLDKVLPPPEMKEESRQVAGSVRAAVPSSHTKAGRMMLLTLLHSTRQGKLGCRFYLSGAWLRGKKGLAITRELQNPTAFVSFIGKKRKEEKKKCLWISLSLSFAARQ